MKSIAFMSQKGGTGKTTLAVHIAVAASAGRNKVVLIDTDPQQSATMWGSNRESKSPVVATVAPSQLAQALDAARADKMTLAVIDSAPHAAPAASEVALLADLIVIPTRPSAFDIAAAANSVKIAQAAGKPFCFVLNSSPYRAPEIPESMELLKQYGGLVAPFAVMDRRAFARSVSTGQGVTEFEEGGKAAAEARMLWEWLRRML